MFGMGFVLKLQCEENINMYFSTEGDCTVTSSSYEITNLEDRFTFISYRHSFISSLATESHHELISIFPQTETGRSV